MSTQVYSNNNTPYWLSANGINQVYFNKLSSPPLAPVGKGLLYELNDGKLYFNGSQVTPSIVGNVTGPTTSTANNIVVFSDTSGDLADSNVHLQTDTNKSLLVVGANSLTYPNNAQCIILGNNSFADTLSHNIIAIGNQCAITPTSGIGNNVLIGNSSATNISGWYNVVIGDSAGANAGNNCIYIGMSAGSSVSHGDNNIIIGSQVPGLSGDASTIRLGGTHTNAYIAGIYGSTISSPSTQTGMLIDSTGKIVSGKTTIFGGMYSNVTSNPQTLTQNVVFKINYGSTFKGDPPFQAAGALLQYIGSKSITTAVLHVMVNFAGTAGDTFLIQLFQKTILITTSSITVTATTTNAFMSVCFPVIVPTVATLDTFQIGITNTTSSNSINLQNWSVTGTLSY